MPQPWDFMLPSRTRPVKNSGTNADYELGFFRRTYFPMASVPRVSNNKSLRLFHSGR